uniref:Uncharacterized protein n=1 Tax=Panagrolaimus sp. ES5 TaxID=591445 RepID=A0AC34GKL6_9BILA
GEPNKYLDYDDYFATKKLLGKLCKTMVESSCHNGKKNQELNKNLDKLEKSFGDNVLVLNDFVNDFDIKTAEKVKEMVVKVDPQMSAMEEIAQFSAALNSLEEWLDLTGAENDREMATLERAKQNLDKQKEIEAQVSVIIFKRLTYIE